MAVATDSLKSLNQREDSPELIGCGRRHLAQPHAGSLAGSQCGLVQRDVRGVRERPDEPRSEPDRSTSHACRHRCRVAVLLALSLHHSEQGPQVVDVASQDSDGVQTGCERHHALARHGAEGRLDSGDTAERARDPDRPAGVRRYTRRHHSGRDGRRSAATGPTRHPAGRSRVARATARGVLCADPPAELVRAGRPDHDRAGPPQELNDRSVTSCAFAEASLRGVLRRSARDVDELLNGDRETVQRPNGGALAYLPRPFDRRQQGSRIVDPHECADLRVPLADAVEAVLGGLQRVHNARTERIEELADAHRRRVLVLDDGPCGHARVSSGGSSAKAGPPPRKDSTNSALAFNASGVPSMRSRPPPRT